MLQRTSRRRAAVYSLIGGYGNTTLTIIQGLVLVPLYLHYLGPRLYGAWLGSGGVLAWISMLDMGLGSLMIQRMANAYGKQDLRSVASYFGSGLLLQIAIVIAIIAPIVLVSTWVPKWMGMSGADATILAGCFILAGLADGTAILANGLSSLAKALQRPLAYNVLLAVAGIVGVATTLILLLLGKGLWALPLGLLARGATLCAATFVDAVILLRRHIQYIPRPDWGGIRELASLSPTLLLTRFGNALAGQSEATLAAILIRPELATVFVLTRRIADVMKLLLDQFAGAFFPTFAHLWGEGERQRAELVYTQILSMYAAAATVLLSAYIVLNGSLLGVWVGEMNFGGNWLTVAIAVAFFVSIRNNLVSYLYSATGEISGGAWIIFGEAVLRVAMMAALLGWIGLIGFPIAMLASGVPVSVLLATVMARKLRGRVSPFHLRDWGRPIHLVMLGAATLVAWTVYSPSWVYVILMGAGWTAIVGLIAWQADPSLIALGGNASAAPSRILRRWWVQRGSTV